MILAAAVVTAALTMSSPCEQRDHQALLAAEKQGDAFLDAFEITKAYDEYEMLESCSRAQHWEEGEARGLMGRARVAYRLARQDETLELSQKAAAIAARIGNGEIEAEALTQAGLVMGMYKNDSTGIDVLERALQRVPPGNEPLAAYVHSQLGWMLASYHRVAEAEQHLEPALRMMPEHHPRRRSVFWFAANLRRVEGRVDEAIAFTREGIRACSDAPLRLWDLKANLGEMLMECGHLEEAAEAFREAVEIIELRRKLAPSPATDVRHFASRIWVYQRLLKAMVALGRGEEALEVAERMRARVLSDSLHAQNEELPLTESERNEQRALNQRIADLNRLVIASSGEAASEARRNLRDARAALDAFTQEIAIHYPRTVAAHAEARTFSLEDNPSRPVAVEYSLQPDCIIVFVVAGRNVEVRRLAVDPADVEKTSSRLLHRIASRDARYTEDARALYDALFAPIASLVRGENTLSIVPDGFLWDVPFDALLDPSGKHLAERYALSSAPSIAMLDWAARRQPSSLAHQELLAFGDPLISTRTSRKAAAYRDLSLGALPDAVREVETLAKLYGNSRTTVFTGAAAREAVLKKMIGDYHVVHLATHGIVDDSSPLYSALVLSASDADNEDGLLEMREMHGLDLHADLIVLSGCDTARGDVNPGEGVIGMSWAILMAGCPTTVVSQWKAESRATARLMIEFHERLLAGDSKAEALRHAQLALLHDPRYSHPFYWAPFVVVGEGSSGIR
jgi:CHAT domain-containing protein